MPEAQSMIAREIRQGIDEARLRALLERALAYPSPQSDLLEDDPQMAAFIRDVVHPEAQALNPDRLMIDRMGNLVATWGAGAPSLALIVYAMTHPQTIMSDAFAPSAVDGAPYGYFGLCIRGRGGCEQKGALAAALTGLRAALSLPVQRVGTIALMALVAGETGRPVAVEHLLEESGVIPQMAIVACGTDNAICLGQKGRVDVQISIKGRQSHSSMPWLGVNALEGAGVVLRRLSAHKVLGEHPHLGPITLTPTGLVTEPRATHTVPERAHITVDRRLQPGEDPQAALVALQALVGEVPPFDLTYTTGAYMYPYEVSEGSRLPRLLQQGWTTTAGRAAGYRYLSGGLDAGYLNARGIESLMFGPGNPDLAHTADDLVALEHCTDASAVFAYALQIAMQDG